MAWNGSGVFTRLYSWVARRDAGSPTNIIGATEMDAEFDGYKTGLENCVTRDGQNVASAALPMGGFTHTNVGSATVRTNYLRVAEYQDGGHVWVAAGGTADAITATYAPAISALTNGCRVRFRALLANATTTPTFAPNGLAAKTIVKASGTALVAGDIQALHHECDVQYNSTTDKWHLLNPIYPFVPTTDLNGLTTDATGGAVADFIPFVDASDANASNKVTVQNFFDNALANLTADTTGGATGDKLVFADASETNVAQTVTVDNLLTNGLQLLTTDSTGGVFTDLIPFVDASESNAGNKVTVELFTANSISSGTDLTSPEANQALYQFLTRKTDGANLRRVTLNQVGAGKQTVWVPAAAMTSRTTNGAASGTTESTANKVMNKTLDFDTTTAEFAQFTIAFPKGWNEGTVTFVPYWTAASGSGTAIFSLAGVALSNDDAIDTAFGTVQTSSDTLITALDVHEGPESAAITIAGTPAVGDITYFQVARDISDTLGVDAKLIGIKLIYTIDSNTDD
jgi:hypothetical protein